MYYKKNSNSLNIYTTLVFFASKLLESYTFFKLICSLWALKWFEDYILTSFDIAGGNSLR